MKDLDIANGSFGYQRRVPEYLESGNLKSNHRHFGIGNAIAQVSLTEEGRDAARNAALEATEALSAAQAKKEAAADAPAPAGPEKSKRRRDARVSLSIVLQQASLVVVANLVERSDAIRSGIFQRK